MVRKIYGFCALAMLIAALVLFFVSENWRGRMQSLLYIVLALEAGREVFMDRMWKRADGYVEDEECEGDPRWKAGKADLDDSRTELDKALDDLAQVLRDRKKP